MTNDIYLVVGLVVLALAIPSIVSAFSEGRAPRIGSIMVLIGGGLVVIAVTQNPGGYSIQEIPHVITRVVGAIIR